MKKYLLAILVGLSVNAIAQGTGTPAQLRVETDANGYLLVAGAAQTLPLSNPTQFNQIRLKTDANNALQVVLTGGAITNPILLPDSTCTAPALSFSSDTNSGIANPAADSPAICGGGKNITKFNYQTVNGDDRTTLFLGTGQAITDTTNDVYRNAIYDIASTVNVTGNTFGAIFLAIGQSHYIVTDTVTKTHQFANVELDQMDFSQSGGAVTLSDIVNTRARFAYSKTSVTLTKNAAIDFSFPGASETGTVGTWVDINFPDPTGNTGTKYAMLFGANYDADLASLTTTSITIFPGIGSSGTLDIHKDGVGGTTTNTLKLINSTASDSMTTAQRAPAWVQSGTAYNSVSTLSEIDSFSMGVTPATNAGTTTATWFLAQSINNAAASNLITLNNAGTMNLTGSLVSSAGVSSGGSFQFSQNRFCTNTLPTRASGFGTNNDGAAATGSNTCAFDFNIGTGGAPTTGVLTLPAAAHGWACSLKDMTTVADITSQTAYTTTSASFSTTIAWSANDHLVGGCFGF